MLAATRVSAEPVSFSPCDDLPAALSALGETGQPEAFGVAQGVAVAAFADPAEPGRSVLKFARGTDAPQSVALPGRVSGLAVSGDGAFAFAIVRLTDRKGALRNVQLARVDLRAARDSLVASLPATARGLAVGSDGSVLLVAARDEIRTFRLPDLASGPLYRVPGENVGVAPLGTSSQILVVQPARVLRVDTAGAQGRDGLAVGDETPSPGPLAALMATAGERGPTAIGPDGRRWCLRGGGPPEPPPAPMAVEVEAVAPEPSPPPPPPAPVEQPPTPPPVTAPPTTVPTDVVSPRDPVPGEPGTVSGRVEGSSQADVAAMVFLGPDNIVKEAARALPDAGGRFSVRGLAPGAYRIVASGKGGRVLICDPAFITVHVGENGAVEAPVMKVLHAP